MQSLPIYEEELYQIQEKVTVVLTLPWVDLGEDEKLQLTKIMGALKDRISPALGLDAFRVVSVDNLDLSTWRARPSQLIYFGPIMKGLNFYEVIQAGNTKMVLSESLADLLTNDASKAKLWQALKQLFA